MCLRMAIFKQSQVKSASSPAANATWRAAKTQIRWQVAVLVKRCFPGNSRGYIACTSGDAWCVESCYCGWCGRGAQARQELASAASGCTQPVYCTLQTLSVWPPRRCLQSGAAERLILLTPTHILILTWYRKYQTHQRGSSRMGDCVGGTRAASSMIVTYTNFSSCTFECEPCLPSRSW